MRSFSPCADKATGDDQRCACKGRRRQRFSEYQPAHDRCPDKGGIFEWNQHLRLRPGISPGQKHERTESEQRGSADGQEKICGRNDGKEGRGDTWHQDRKSVVEGTSVSVRVDLGGRRIIKKKIHNKEE